MKRIALFSVLLVALTLGACKCPEIGHAVGQAEASQELVFGEYLAYVTADPKLDSDQKDDRKKLVESARRIMEALKKAAEE